MSKASICLILFLFLFSGQLFCQNFSGKIVDKNGLYIYGGTAYIKEINQGIICNEKGEFQTTLSTGSYTIEYRSLGYKPVSEKIEISNAPIFRTIVLDEDPFELKEVTITNKEDPAYPIIRKTIEKAPYFLNSAKRYVSDVYIKANMGLDNVPKLINKMTSVEGMKMSDLKEQMFVQESYNELEFHAPDKYTQTVKAFTSSLPDNYDPKDSFGVMTSSLYAPMYNGNVSPLNPNAFSYYKYRYEGFIEENGEIINKIRFDAKYNDPILMNGYLYIADNIWSIKYAELSKDIFGIKQDFTITYQEVVPDVHLPITYSLASTINILGLKGYFNYFSSLKYTDIEISDNIVQQIELIEKKKKSLEIRRDTLYTIKTDTLATKRDSTFWSRIRTLPLEYTEKESLRRKDSIQQHIDSIRKKYHNPGFSFGSLILGGRIGSDTARFSFRYDGLLLAVPEYNFVDGAWIGQKVYLKTRFRRHNILEISPYAYYTWGRNTIIYGSDFNLKYAPMNNGELKISAGSVSEDFNPNGITRFDNFITSAMYRESDNYFYQKDFISVQNTIELANGLKLTTGLEIAKRHGLINHANWGIWGNSDKIKPNIYSNDKFDATSYSVALSYTPRAYYSISNGKKKYEKVTSPVFTAEYKEGFSSWQTNNSKYRLLRGEINQNIKIGHFNRLDYFIEGGSFLGSTSQTHFADYHHFNTSKMFSISKWPHGTFVLLDNYEASTNRYWLQGYLNYESRYLLLKRIPFLQGLPITENIHLKTLYTPDFKMYSEAGYSIDLIRLINFGAHVSFHKGKYDGFGFRLCYILRDILKVL